MRWADIGLAGHDRLSSAGVIKRIGLDHGRIARRIACPDYGQKNFIKTHFGSGAWQNHLLSRLQQSDALAVRVWRNW